MAQVTEELEKNSFVLIPQTYTTCVRFRLKVSCSLKLKKTKKVTEIKFAAFFATIAKQPTFSSAGLSCPLLIKHISDGDEDAP